MASPISLKSLVHAIASAVTSAQSDIEKSQLRQLASYFDEQRRPKMMKFRLPQGAVGGARTSDDAPDGHLVAAPLLTLVPQAQLRIKQVDIDFEVELGELSDPIEEDNVSTLDGFTSNYRVLKVDHAPSLFSRRKPARVQIKVEAVEPIEGTARLIGELNKLVGALIDEPAPAPGAVKPPEEP